MKETCEFEKWLEQIEEKIKELPVEEKLEIIAEEIYSRYDARVWFSEISGKRWSYIAGWGGYDPTPVHQVLLSSRYGMTIEEVRIPEAEGEALLSFLKRGLFT